MRIKRLELVAFGPFTNQALAFDSKGPGLTVIFGPNEAGKSSSLRGLKCLLYGIPERTPDNFLHPNDQLLLGGSLIADNGKQITFLRRKRRKTSLFDIHDDPLAPEALSPFIRGIDQDEFETLYGIDHEALVQGGRDILDQKGEVGQALFSAGAGISSLREVLTKMDLEADELFRPRASTRHINRALADYKKLQKEMRAATLSGQDWMRVEQDLRKAETELARVEEKRREKDTERRGLERLKQALPQLALRREYLDQLQRLGETTPLPADFTQRRKKAADLLQQAQQARKTKSQHLSSLREKLKSVSFNSALLDESEWIEALSQKLGSHRKAMKDRPRLEGMRIACKSEAATLLRQLPTDLPLERLERLRPFLGKRKAIQTLASKYETLKQGRQQHRRQRRRLEGALAEIDRSLQQIPSFPDTDDLVRAVKLARKSGDPDDQVLENKRLHETRKIQLEKELSQLGLWMGDLKTACELPIPLRETILRFEEKFRSCEEQRQTAEKELENLTEKQTQITGDIKEIEVAGEVPSEKELAQVRKRRDTQWQLLKRHWPKGEDVSAGSSLLTETNNLMDVYEKDVKRADQLSDRLRREADRVHKFAALKTGRLTNQEAIKEVQEKLRQHNMETKTVSGKWQLLWEPCDVQPLPPKEMLNWCDDFQKIRSGAMELSHLEGEIHTRKSQIEKLRNGLLAASDNLEKSKMFEDETLEPVLIFCETLLERLERKKKDRERLLDKQKDLTDNLKTARQQEETAMEELAQWEKRWSESAALFIKSESLSAKTLSLIEPEEANDIVENLQGCFLKLKEAGEVQERIEGIDRDATDFVAEIQSLVKKVAPDLEALEVEQAVLQLQKLLKQNLEQKTLFQKFTREIEEAENHINKAVEAVSTAETQLSELKRIAGCKESDDLEEVERIAREHLDLETKCRETETALLTSAEGLSISQLEEQAAMINPDELPGKIDALSREIERHLDPEIRRISETLGEKKRELQQMDGSAKAAEAALSAEQTLAAIRRMSEHFIRLKVASSILKQEIERFRRENQDPILTMASRFFRQLTLDSFEGLRTDEDERGQPVLAGLRHQNRMIRVEGMSSGTRDQLYLALRLASLEKRREMGETMPFIVDDILVNFDDERAKATLEALAGLAVKTQVILFTHHERIAEEAREMGKRTDIEVHHI
ncbi:MAG: AAA family ATPase [Deltaproteobacteria bacterium]|nr:AAA family ATPase [Deltaproteobacteria bacterium]